MTTDTNRESTVLVDDERLADFYDDGHARRNWGIQLYVDGIAARIERTVERADRRQNSPLWKIANQEATKELLKKWEGQK